MQGLELESPFINGSQTPPIKSNRKILIIATVIALVVMGILLIVVVFMNNSKQSVFAEYNPEFPPEMVYLSAWDEPTDMKPPSNDAIAKFKQSGDIYNDNITKYAREQDASDITAYFEGVGTNTSVGFNPDTGRRVTSSGVVPGDNDDGFTQQ